MTKRGNTGSPTKYCVSLQMYKAHFAAVDFLDKSSQGLKREEDKEVIDIPNCKQVYRKIQKSKKIMGFSKIISPYGFLMAYATAFGVNDFKTAENDIKMEGAAEFCDLVYPDSKKDERRFTPLVALLHQLEEHIGRRRFDLRNFLQKYMHPSANKIRVSYARKTLSRSYRCSRRLRPQEIYLKNQARRITN